MSAVSPPSSYICILVFLTTTGTTAEFINNANDNFKTYDVY